MCPYCEVELDEIEGQWVCSECGRVFFCSDPGRDEDWEAEDRDDDE